MIEHITTAEDATPEDAFDVLNLSLGDLIDGDIPEDMARQYLEIGTDHGIDVQMRKFQTNPHAYLLYRNDKGRVDGILKATGWYRADEKGYGANSVSRLINKWEIATIGNRYSKKRLGLQALTASYDVDQDTVIDSLVAQMLLLRNKEDMSKDIIVPLHTKDPAKGPLIAHGFEPTGRTSETVQLTVAGSQIDIPMVQELYVRKAA
jgi:hypothetical protein